MYRLNSKNRLSISNRIAMAAAVVLALTMLVGAPEGGDAGDSMAVSLLNVSQDVSSGSDDTDNTSGKRGFNIPLLLFRGG